MNMSLFVPEENKEEALELKELFIDRVDVVGKPANGKTFTILKSDSASVECGNCHATHSADALRKAKKSLPGIDLTCECGEVIKVEVRKEDEEEEKKRKEKEEEERKKKEEEDQKKKKESEADSMNDVVEKLAKVAEEKSALQEKVKHLAEENQKKENQIKELEEKLTKATDENKELEKLADDAMKLAQEAAGDEGEEE